MMKHAGVLLAAMLLCLGLGPRVTADEKPASSASLNPGWAAGLGVAGIQLEEAAKDRFPGHDGHIMPAGAEQIADFQAAEIAVHSRCFEHVPFTGRTRTGKLEIKTPTYTLSCPTCVWSDHGNKAALYADIRLVTAGTQYAISANFATYDKQQNVLSLDGLVKVTATKPGAAGVVTQTGDSGLITLGVPPSLPVIQVTTEAGHKDAGPNAK